MRFRPGIVCSTLLAAALASPLGAEERISFNRDVRPILSDNCFLCHGPDKNQRKAKLRLDVREEALKKKAIVPGKPNESELVERIFSNEEETRMPPPAAHKKLAPEQKELLKRWIAEGAEYQGHWAYEKPIKPRVPAGSNGIDVLVEQRLAKRGLKPAPEAERRTLARRLSFDLLGLPPKPAEVAAFVNDPAADAYEKLVEKLLASPHYGERLALGWLDVVRFADTIGYHSDNPRNVWPYRDYVIGAFNQNKPFDRFTVEQLAGDLVPGSTPEQKVASCFNRLLLTTEEGGAQPKDYEARMLTDRVRAVGTVWLGQTLGCCQCHDHKFDPGTIRDFYALGAFFADIQEPIIGGREPGMVTAFGERALELERLRVAAAGLRKQLDDLLAANQEAWEKSVRDELSATTDKQPTGAPRTTLPPSAIVEILRMEPAQRDAGKKKQLADYYQKSAPAPADLKARLAGAQKAATDFEAKLPRCLVSIAMKNPRTVRILPRGNWMDGSGAIVQPALPHYLPQPAQNDGRRLTRLDLAQWLVARDNPLTARVFVNRLWKQFFGAGLSKSVDDFGSQGEWPVHPELLDWLACAFMDGGWDVKQMVRAIVTSRTYRQASTASRELQAGDPYNRELARQSRFRLDAEQVRDNALAVAGILSPTIGGPSVKPYQPDGYWENLNFPTRPYVPDKGENQYRRGLYTWWQRSFLHPSMLAFDAPTREECAADRCRSNIPQQALVLLNDPTYVEAARVFAARIIREGGPDAPARIAWAWQQALQRPPRADELKTISELVAKHRQQYAQDPKAAEALLKVGLAPLPKELDAAELAAWTSMARVLFNLHETITRN